MLDHNTHFVITGQSAWNIIPNIEGFTANQWLIIKL